MEIGMLCRLDGQELVVVLFVLSDGRVLAGYADPADSRPCFYVEAHRLTPAGKKTTITLAEDNA